MNSDNRTIADRIALLRESITWKSNPKSQIKSSRALLIGGLGFSFLFPFLFFFVKPIVLVGILVVLVALFVALYQPLLSLLSILVLEPVLRHWIEVSMGSGIPDLSILRAFAVFFGLMVLAQHYFFNVSFKKIGTTEWSMIIFGTLAVVSLYKSNYLTTDAQELLDSYLLPFFFFYLAKDMVNTRQDLLKLLLMVFSAGILIGLIGTGQKITSGAIIPLMPSGFRPIHPTRMTGPFVNSAELGAVMGQMTCFAAAFIGYYKGTKNALIIALFLFFLACVVLCMSRGPWVGLLAGFVTLAVYNKELRRYLTVFAMISGGAVLVALPLILSNEAFVERFSEVDSIFNRLVSLTTSLNMWLDKPLFGYGFGGSTYIQNSLSHLKTMFGINARWGAEVRVPHNEFIHMLVLMGTIGFIPFVMIYKKCLDLRKYIFSQPQDFEKRMIIAVVANTVLYIGNGLFVDLFFFSYNTLLLFTTLGAVYGYLYVNTSKTSSPAAH